MLAIWAKHTNKQCASAETCATCSNVRMFFFGARRFRKFADKNEICGRVGRRTPTPQKGSR